MGLKFDLTINLGNVISIIGFIFTLYSLHASNTKRIDKLEMKIDIMYQWFCANVIDRK